MTEDFTTRDFQLTHAIAVVITFVIWIRDGSFLEGQPFIDVVPIYVFIWAAVALVYAAVKTIRTAIRKRSIF